MSLTACANSDRFATLAGSDGTGGGACSAFPRPPYAIRGATRYDQRWADETTEAGVAGCGWQRPARRPASLDVRPRAAVTAPAGAVPLPAPAPRKRNFWHWFRKKPAEVQGG